MARHECCAVFRSNAPSSHTAFGHVFQLFLVAHILTNPIKAVDNITAMQMTLYLVTVAKKSRSALRQGSVSPDFTRLFGSMFPLDACYWTLDTREGERSLGQQSCFLTAERRRRRPMLNPSLKSSRQCCLGNRNVRVQERAG